MDPNPTKSYGLLKKKMRRESERFRKEFLRIEMEDKGCSITLRPRRAMVTPERDIKVSVCDL